MMLSFMEVDVSPVIDDVVKPTITIAPNVFINDVEFYGSRGIVSDIRWTWLNPNVYQWEHFPDKNLIKETLV